MKKGAVISPFGACTAHCQVSQLFVFPLNPYGRLWLHVHDTGTYRSHGIRLFLAEEALKNHPGEGEAFDRGVTPNYVALFFSLRIVH